MMMEALNEFHFLRPWALLITLFGLMLIPLWQRLCRHRDALQRMIAPHLLRHLKISAGAQQRWLPIHGTSLLLILGGLAVAGPSWDRALPPFAEEKTRVTLLIDLSPSMGTGSNTLALAQEHIQTLAQQNPGWHLSLIGYGPSAHLILPPTRDRELLSLYLNSLEAGLIPGSGRNLEAALALAQSSLQQASDAQALILITDDLGNTQLGEPATPAGSILVLAPETTLNTAAAELRIEQLGAHSRTFSTRESDVRWLENQVEAHFTRLNNRDDELEWRDLGYWLVWPALLLSLVSVRKGWQVQWCWLPLALFLSAPPQAEAGTLADAFLTPDQQGRIAFESGRYSEAAEQFQSLYLRGVSAYRAADYALAIEHFSQLETAEAWFYLGNRYARQLELHKAVTAYETALQKQPDFPAARQNLALIEPLARQLDAEREGAPEMEADALRFDKRADQGTPAEIQRSTRMNDAVWLENLNTSATEFLRRRFAAEQAAGAAHED